MEKEKECKTKLWFIMFNIGVLVMYTHIYMCMITYERKTE